MGSFAKWLGGGLGFVMGGPIGAIIGFLVGSVVDSTSIYTTVHFDTLPDQAGRFRNESSCSCCSSDES